MIVELRSTGSQTIAPPSLHPSGEFYVWYEESEVTIIEGERLQREVATLAAASLLCRYWDEGRRHKLALCLPSVLMRSGWAIEDVRHFIESVAEVAGDDEIKDRLKGIEDTAEKLRKGEKTTGIPTLKRILPQDIADRIIEWLVIGTSANSGDEGSDALEWPEPQVIPVELAPVPSLVPEMIPAPLRGWITDVAERAQIPLEFCAVAALVSVAAVVGNRVAICPKRHDDWKVIPNLWGGVIGRPGILKSPAMAEGTKPLKRLAFEKQEEHKDAMRLWEVEQMVRDAQREKLKASIKEAVKAGNEVNANQYRIELNEIEKLSAPVERRYIVNDSTIEKLGEILNQNPPGVLLFRDELIGFLRSLDKEGHECDRAFFLEAWAGDGSFVYDRIGRGTVHIESVTLSILGSIQPGPLSQYLRGTLSGGTGDDGLLQRFQLLVYPDVTKHWRNVDRWPKTEEKNRAFEIFKRLDQLDPQIVHAEPDEDGPAYLRFSDEAQGFFDEWRTELESEVRAENGKHPALEAHLSKYRSLMPSLALIFHLLDWADGRNQGGPVSFEAAELAAAWCSFLQKHAERIYGLALDSDAIHAKRLCDKILKGELPDTFTARDVYQKHWSGLTSPSEVRGPLELLEDFGWIRSVTVRRQDGGRPTVFYYINPKTKKEAE